VRKIYATLLPTTAKVFRQGDMVNGVTNALTQLSGADGQVQCRIRRFRTVSGKGENGPEEFTTGMYMGFQIKDLRCLDFAYTSNGTVAPNILRNDQIRVGSAHYNVKDIYGDSSYAVGLTAVCQRSA
jgi:hypothetical protein